jgi:hypothetical protein
MKIEYAQTAGEGKLISYGVADFVGGMGVGHFILSTVDHERDILKSMVASLGMTDGGTVLFRMCSDDCETGR